MASGIPKEPSARDSDASRREAYLLQIESIVARVGRRARDELERARAVQDDGVTLQLCREPVSLLRPYAERHVRQLVVVADMLQVRGLYEVDALVAAFK